MGLGKFVRSATGLEEVTCFFHLSQAPSLLHTDLTPNPCPSTKASNSNRVPPQLLIQNNLLRDLKPRPSFRLCLIQIPPTCSFKVLPLLLQSGSTLTSSFPLFHPTYSHYIPPLLESKPIIALILTPPPTIMLRPHPFPLGSDQSLPHSTLTPPIMRFPITLLCSISTSPLQVPPRLLPLCPASTSSHHAPPPHLAPGPAPLRTPVGGGAHGCARGSRGQSLAGSPPVSLETVGGDASYGGEGEEGEKGLSGEARATPRGSGPGLLPRLLTLGCTCLRPLALLLLLLLCIPWHAAAARVPSTVTSPLLPATPLCVTS